MVHDQGSSLPSRFLLLETASYEIRRLDEERAAVAAEAWDDFIREWMGRCVVQIVVVSNIESSAGTWSPTEQRLRSQSRVKRAVVENQTSERRFRKLIRPTAIQNILVKCDEPVVIAP